MVASKEGGEEGNGGGGDPGEACNLGNRGEGEQSQHQREEQALAGFCLEKGHMAGLEGKKNNKATLGLLSDNEGRNIKAIMLRSFLLPPIGLPIQLPTHTTPGSSSGEIG